MITTFFWNHFPFYTLIFCNILQSTIAHLMSLWFLIFRECPWRWKRMAWRFWDVARRHGRMEKCFWWIPTNNRMLNNDHYSAVMGKSWEVMEIDSSRKSWEVMEINSSRKSWEVMKIDCGCGPCVDMAAFFSLNWQWTLKY